MLIYINIMIIVADVYKRQGMQLPAEQEQVFSDKVGVFRFDPDVYKRQSQYIVIFRQKYQFKTLKANKITIHCDFICF